MSKSETPQQNRKGELSYEKMVMGVENTYSGMDIRCRSWKELAEWGIRKAVVTDNYERFLPYCNGWNLDYPHKGESVEDYRVRLTDMARERGLI